MTPTVADVASKRRFSLSTWFVIAFVALLLAGIAGGTVVLTSSHKSNGVRYVNATIAQMLVPPSAMPGFTSVSPQSIEDTASNLTQPGSIASLPCFRGALKSDPEQQATAEAGFVQNSTGMGLFEALVSLPSLKVATAKFDQGVKEIHACGNFTFNYAGVPLSVSLTPMSFPPLTQALQAFRFTVSGQGISVGFDVIIAERSTVDVALFIGPTDPTAPTAVAFVRKALDEISGAPGVIDIGANNAFGSCSSAYYFSDYLQGSVASGGPSYVVPPGAVEIRSWAIEPDDSGGQGRLEVWRKIPIVTGVVNYQLIGASKTQTLVGDTLNRFRVDIPVSGGDILGLGQFSPQLACGVNTNDGADDVESDSVSETPPWRGEVVVFTPYFEGQLNVSAEVLVAKPSALHPYKETGLG